MCGRAQSTLGSTFMAYDKAKERSAFQMAPAQAGTNCEGL